MAGIADILNHSDGSDESNEQTTSSSTSNHRRTTSLARSSVSLDGLGVGLETSRGRRSIPKSKIDKKYLANKKLVQISIRRKSATRKSVSTENTSGVNTSKLHIKYLEGRHESEAYYVSVDLFFCTTRSSLILIENMYMH